MHYSESVVTKAMMHLGTMSIVCRLLNKNDMKILYIWKFRSNFYRANTFILSQKSNKEISKNKTTSEWLTEREGRREGAGDRLTERGDELTVGDFDLGGSKNGWEKRDRGRVMAMQGLRRRGTSQRSIVVVSGEGALLPVSSSVSMRTK